MNHHAVPLLAVDRIESPYDGSALAPPLPTERRTPHPYPALPRTLGFAWKESDRLASGLWILRTATWPMTGDGQGVRGFGARATAPRRLLPILCISQGAVKGLSADAVLLCQSRLRPRQVHGETTAPAHPDRVNDAVLGRRLAAWQARCLQVALTDECPLELCEGPHHRQQQIRHRRILAGERQVLVIKIEPNSSGRQVLDTATDIIEVASVSRLSQTRVYEIPRPEVQCPSMPSWPDFSHAALETAYFVAVTVRMRNPAKTVIPERLCQIGEWNPSSRSSPLT